MQLCHFQESTMKMESKWLGYYPFTCTCCVCVSSTWIKLGTLFSVKTRTIQYNSFLDFCVAYLWHTTWLKICISTTQEVGVDYNLSLIRREQRQEHVMHMKQILTSTIWLIPVGDPLNRHPFLLFLVTYFALGRVVALLQTHIYLMGLYSQQELLCIRFSSRRGFWLVADRSDDPPFPASYI